MIRVCLAGIGSMGNVHFKRYVKLMEEKEPVRLTAVYDINRTRFDRTMAGHPDLAESIQFYDNFEEMLSAEKPDAVDIVLPDHLHCDYTVNALHSGVNVLCEKPMALNSEEIQAMLNAARQTGKALMIAHCCRFMGSYRRLKSIVETNAFGRPLLAGFHRLSGLPVWSEQNWFLNQKTSGGCIMDMHIHDVDMLLWLFGRPEAVSALGFSAVPGSGIDGLTAQYKYPGFAVNIQSNWAVAGKDVPFRSGFHVDFERGSVYCNDGVIAIYEEGKPPVIEKDDTDKDSYYEEIRSFIHSLESHSPCECRAEESAEAVELVLLERKSIDGGGVWLEV